MGELHEPRLEQILEFCAREPVERVFLEDVARRGLGRFVAAAGADGLDALCHLGANVVPAGERCDRFARRVERSRARMLIGEERAVGELWSAVQRRLGPPREDRHGQPVFSIEAPPEPGGSGLRAATPADLDRLLPACALAHEEELGVNPLARDPDGFRWRTGAQIRTAARGSGSRTA